MKDKTGKLSALVIVLIVIGVVGLLSVLWVVFSGIRSPSAMIPQKCILGDPGMRCTNFRITGNEISLTIENVYDSAHTLTGLGLTSDNLQGGACSWEGEVELSPGGRTDIRVTNCNTKKNDWGRYSLSMSHYATVDGPSLTRTAEGELVGKVS